GRVGAVLLADPEQDARRAVEARELHRVLGGQPDRRDVAEADRVVGLAADHDPAEVLRPREEAGHAEREFAPALRDRAGRRGGVALRSSLATLGRWASVGSWPAIASTWRATVLAIRSPLARSVNWTTTRETPSADVLVTKSRSANPATASSTCWVTWSSTSSG